MVAFVVKKTHMYLEHSVSVVIEHFFIEGRHPMSSHHLMSGPEGIIDLFHMCISAWDVKPFLHSFYSRLGESNLLFQIYTYTKE